MIFEITDLVEHRSADKGVGILLAFSFTGKMAKVCFPACTGWFYCDELKQFEPPTSSEQA